MIPSVISVSKSGKKGSISYPMISPRTEKSTCFLKSLMKLLWR